MSQCQEFTVGKSASHHSTEDVPTPWEEVEEEVLVVWEDNDSENPYSWPQRKKVGILLTTMMLTVNSTMGSALPSNALPLIADEWDVTSQTQKVLPISIYLVGYVMGKYLSGCSLERCLADTVLGQDRSFGLP